MYGCQPFFFFSSFFFFLFVDPCARQLERAAQQIPTCFFAFAFPFFFFNLVVLRPIWVALAKPVTVDLLRSFTLFLFFFSF